MVTLKLLAEVHHVKLEDQVLKAALGMNGSGRYGAQCGLVEGMIMFLGIWGDLKGYSYGRIQMICNLYAEKFEKTFGSLTCGRLRPEAEATAEDPAHACRELKVKALLMDLAFLDIIEAIVGF